MDVIGPWAEATGRWRVREMSAPEDKASTIARPYEFTS